jgi:hypothetical protein
LSASRRSHRAAVEALIASTTPAVTASSANSAPDHRDSGTPVVAGSSHANALTCACCTALNRGGRPHRFRSARPFIPSAANRPRHLRTVSTPTRRRRAITALAGPLAASNTI